MSRRGPLAPRRARAVAVPRADGVPALGLAFLIALLAALLACALAPRAASAATEDALAKPVRDGIKARNSAAAPRRLEDVTIEGEIPVPQVLFITARDQRRFMDFNHRQYLKSSLAVGREAGLPARIAVVRDRTADQGKETTP